MTIRSLLFNPVTACLALIVSAVLIWSLRQTALNTNQTNQALQEAQAEIIFLERAKDEQALRAEAAAEPFTQEKIIRDELLMQKSDEAIVQLPAIPSIAPELLTPSPSPRPLQLWYEKLLYKK